MTIKEIRETREGLLAEARKLTELAASEKRDLTDEEIKQVDAGLDHADKLKADLEKAEKAQARENRLTTASAWKGTLLPRVTKPPAPSLSGGGIGGDGASVTDPPSKPKEAPAGFESFGHMLQAVALAEDPRQAHNPLVEQLYEVNRQAATGLNESIPSQGGFLVGRDWANELIIEAYNSSAVLNGGSGYAGVRRIPLSAGKNGVTINGIDETSRATGSRWGGVRTYWLNEAGTKLPTKPKFKAIELNLKKLIGLCYATDELLQDASALEAIIRAAFAEEFAFAIQDALINGSGAGMPLGILGAGCLVSVAKEVGQEATSIVKENIDKMYTRMKPSSVSRAAFFINQNCYPQLFKMTLDVGTGGVPVFLPPGGLSVSPYGTLMGRPVIPIEQCASVGTVGDIIFADMSQYLFIEGGGVQSDSSIHVAFTTDETVFRFVYRCDGQTAMAKAVTPFKGTGDTVSSFIALATRSGS